jgi:hypothetical protein
VKRAIRAASVVLGAASTSACVSALRALGKQHRFTEPLPQPQLGRVQRPDVSAPQRVNTKEGLE